MVMTVPSLLPTYAPFPFTMTRGENDRVWDDQGNAYWDFYGGHCVCLTGHCHPKVVKAIQEQAENLLFYSTAGHLNLRDEAAERLVRYAGAPIASVFFCNSGAEANENALKTAALLTGRTRFAAFTGGWHGRTALALAVTDDPPIQKGYEPFLAEVHRLRFNDFEDLESFDFESVAAAILEPIQSMSGIVEVDRNWLRELRERCTRAGTMLIFDEIQTGFGRLGAPFGKDVYGVAPDMISVAKGIASGVPMGAVLLTAELAERLKPGAMGSTFGGGPIACAAMEATLQILHEDKLAEKALAREREIRVGLAGTSVRGVRGKGLLLGLDCGPEAKGLKAHLFEKRVLVGGSHDPNVLRLMPPLTLTRQAVEALLDAVRTYPGAAA